MGCHVNAWNASIHCLHADVQAMTACSMLCDMSTIPAVKLAMQQPKSFEP